MAIEHETVMAVFDDETRAERTLQEFRDLGFAATQLQLLAENEETEGRDFAGEFARKGLPEAESLRYQEELAEGRVVVCVTVYDRLKETVELLQHNGASSIRHANAPAQMDEAESVEYDPIKGPLKTPEEEAPVDESGYGLRRDPRVETSLPDKAQQAQAIARNNDVEEEMTQDTFFGLPVEPGTVEPGSLDDPNVRPPRVP